MFDQSVVHFSVLYYYRVLKKKEMLRYKVQTLYVWWV